MRTLLLGMNNPHSDDPRHDLCPSPKNCTGWRIWKMLNDRTGASQQDYVRTFARRNLIRGRKWSRDKIHDAAYQATFFAKRGSTVILLGDEVRRAMNAVLQPKLEKILIHPQVVDGVAYRCVPHPSGRNHFYNDPVAREIVASLLEDLYEEARQTEEEQKSDPSAPHDSR